MRHLVVGGSDRGNARSGLTRGEACGDVWPGDVRPSDLGLRPDADRPNVWRGAAKDPAEGLASSVGECGRLSGGPPSSGGHVAAPGGLDPRRAAVPGIDEFDHVYGPRRWPDGEFVAATPRKTAGTFVTVPRSLVEAAQVPVRAARYTGPTTARPWSRLRMTSPSLRRRPLPPRVTTGWSARRDMPVRRRREPVRHADRPALLSCCSSVWPPGR